MQKALTISIVIPVYNEENYLEECLKAIQAQTVMPDSVIVVDNNSYDQTVKIAQEFSFVTLLREKQQGVLFARDTGFNSVTTDIIGRIDADTHLAPNWVETVGQLFTKYPEYSAVNGPVYYYEMPMSKKNYWIDHQVRLRLYKGHRETPFLFGSNSAIRRSAWEEVNKSICRDDRMVHEDLDLAVHLIQSEKSILYDRRLLAGTSARRYDDSIKSFRHYMAMYLYSYKKHGINSLMPRIATTIYWFGYFTGSLLRRSYDPITKKYSLRQLWRGHEARKNPMADR